MELELFYQSSESIMENWTKEITAIGQAAVAQNVSDSTTLCLYNIFWYLPEIIMCENSKYILSSATSENSSFLYVVKF
jgi:hypothetical protein